MLVNSVCAWSTISACIFLVFHCLFTRILYPVFSLGFIGLTFTWISFSSSHCSRLVPIHLLLSWNIASMTNAVLCSEPNIYYFACFSAHCSLRTIQFCVWSFQNNYFYLIATYLRVHLFKHWNVFLSTSKETKGRRNVEGKREKYASVESWAWRKSRVVMETVFGKALHSLRKRHFVTGSFSDEDRLSPVPLSPFPPPLSCHRSRLACSPCFPSPTLYRQTRQCTGVRGTPAWRHGGGRPLGDVDVQRDVSQFRGVVQGRHRAAQLFRLPADVWRSRGQTGDRRGFLGWRGSLLLRGS